MKRYKYYYYHKDPFITFHENEVVYISKETYYLITIGFKVKKVHALLWKRYLW